jgi:ABC-type antimicrobial peptide transport system permease subunit
MTTAMTVEGEARQDVRAVVDDVTTMDAVVARAVAPWRFSMWTFSLFAVMAFALATVGLVGVVSLDVAHRSHEFAVRLAVGADRAAILARVMRSIGSRLLVGVSLGLFVAIASSRTLGGLLFGVSPIDATTYGTVIVLVMIVVVAASYAPARRAASTDPAVLFRTE